MNLYAQLVQATPSQDYPALQLPGIDIDQAKSLSRKGISSEGWQRRLTEDPEIANLIGDEGVRIAKELPQIQLTDARFEGTHLLDA